MSDLDQDLRLVGEWIKQADAYGVTRTDFKGFVRLILHLNHHHQLSLEEIATLVKEG